MPYREDGQRLPFPLGDEVTLDLLGREASVKKMGVIQEGIFDAQGPQQARQGRIPHPFGEPDSLRPPEKMFLQIVRHEEDLPYRIPLRDVGQEGLVEPPAKKLHLLPIHHLLYQGEDLWPLRLHPLPEGTREMEAEAEVRGMEHSFQEGPVTVVYRPGENGFEVPHWLMIVNRKRKEIGGHQGSSRASRALRTASLTISFASFSTFNMLKIFSLFSVLSSTL